MCIDTSGSGTCNCSLVLSRLVKDALNIITVAIKTNFACDIFSVRELSNGEAMLIYFLAEGVGASLY